MEQVEKTLTKITQAISRLENKLDTLREDLDSLLSLTVRNRQDLEYVSNIMEHVERGGRIG